jgi:hypothetical protein
MILVVKPVNNEYAPDKEGRGKEKIKHGRC